MKENKFSDDKHFVKSIMSCNDPELLKDVVFHLKNLNHKLNDIIDELSEPPSSTAPVMSIAKNGCALVRMPNGRSPLLVKISKDVDKNLIKPGMWAYLSNKNILYDIASEEGISFFSGKTATVKSILNKHEILVSLNGDREFDDENDISNGLVQVTLFNGIQVSKGDKVLVDQAYSIAHQKITDNGKRLSDYNFIKNYLLEDDEYVLWEDVKGLSEQKESLERRLLRSFIRKLKTGNHSKKTPQGVLFSGPSGGGKTFLARAIVNRIISIAVESDIPLVTDDFLFIKVKDVKNKFYGESERIINKIFEEASKIAKEEAKCVIIFIDEIDSFLSGSRNSDYLNSSSADRSILGEFLKLMDDLPPTVMVIGTTNSADILDFAIERRFPLKLNIPKPDRNSFIEITMHYANDVDSKSRHLSHSLADHIFSCQKKNQILELLLTNGERVPVFLKDFFRTNGALVERLFTQFKSEMEYRIETGDTQVDVNYLLQLADEDYRDFISSNIITLSNYRNYIDLDISRDNEVKEIKQMQAPVNNKYKYMRICK